MNEDKIEIEILQDGRIRTSTPGSVSAANHANAEQFFRFISSMTDGKNTREKIALAHTHHHHGQAVKEGA